MKYERIHGALFGAALLMAASGFAQTATSPQRGDEDPVPKVSTPSAKATDTNSAETATGSPATGSGAVVLSPAGTETSPGKTGSGVSANVSSPATSPRTYTGTVKMLNAGHTIAVTTASGKVQTFDLIGSPAMDSSVAVGSRVRIQQTVDGNGHTVVTVEPYR